MDEKEFKKLKKEGEGCFFGFLVFVVVSYFFIIPSVKDQYISWNTVKENNKIVAECYSVIDYESTEDGIYNTYGWNNECDPEKKERFGDGFTAAQNPELTIKEQIFIWLGAFNKVRLF